MGSVGIVKPKRFQKINRFQQVRLAGSIVAVNNGKTQEPRIAIERYNLRAFGKTVL
jgi:hypothetical protein